MRKIFFYIMLALVGWSLSCDEPEEASEQEISVRYTLSGGWVGGIHTILSISTDSPWPLWKTFPLFQA